MAPNLGFSDEGPILRAHGFDPSTNSTILNKNNKDSNNDKDNNNNNNNNISSIFDINSIILLDQGWRRGARL